MLLWGEDWDGLDMWREGMSGMLWEGFGRSRFLVIDRQAWHENMEENMEELRFQLCTVQAQDRSGWKTIIDRLTLWKRELNQEERNTHFWEINISAKTAEFVISVENI